MGQLLEGILTILVRVLYTEKPWSSAVRFCGVIDGHTEGCVSISLVALAGGPAGILIQKIIFLLFDEKSSVVVIRRGQLM